MSAPPIKRRFSDASGLEVPRGLLDDRTLTPEEAEAQSERYEGLGASVWRSYNNKARHYDEDLVKDAEETVDVLLIFAGLFSAVVTAFISITYPMLQPNPNDTLNAILQELRGSNSPSNSPQLPGTSFDPPNYATRVNCFLFAGLFTSIFVALLALLVKQWTRSYERDLEGVSSPHLRARIRHYRFIGSRKWRFDEVVASLSIFMYFSLFISAIGILDLLLSTARVVGLVAVLIFTIWALAFAVTSVLPVAFKEAPFRSPLSRSLVGLVRWITPRRSQRCVHTLALDEYVDQSQEVESNENSFIRERVDIDLDIICYLLATADKSTDRAVMEACFEKLPALDMLEENHAGLIVQKDIIPQIYIYLARGCIGDPSEPGYADAIPKSRLNRAKTLCKFLTWFLSLPRTTDQAIKLKELLYNDGFDPRELPQKLREDYRDDAIATGLAALGALDHFDAQSSLKTYGTRGGQGAAYGEKVDQVDTAMCPACDAGRKKILGKTASNAKNFSPTETNTGAKTTNADKATSAKVADIISLQLISQTDCLLRKYRKAADLTDTSELNRTTSILCQDLNKVLEEHCSASMATVPRLWKKALMERQNGAPVGMQEVWFRPLLANRRVFPKPRRHGSTSQVDLQNASLKPPGPTPVYLDVNIASLSEPPSQIVDPAPTATPHLEVNIIPSSPIR